MQAFCCVQKQAASLARTSALAAASVAVPAQRASASPAAADGRTTAEQPQQTDGAQHQQAQAPGAQPEQQAEVVVEAAAAVGDAPNSPGPQPGGADADNMAPLQPGAEGALQLDLRAANVEAAVDDRLGAESETTVLGAGRGGRGQGGRGAGRGGRGAGRGGRGAGRGGRGRGGSSAASAEPAGAGSRRGRGRTGAVPARGQGRSAKRLRQLTDSDSDEENDPSVSNAASANRKVTRGRAAKQRLMQAQQRDEAELPDGLEDSDVEVEL